jgi:hypothetical protein
MWIEELRKISVKRLGDRGKIETSGPLMLGTIVKV